MEPLKSIKPIKPFRNVYIFHLIDHATTFSAGAIISTKRKEITVDKYANIGQRCLIHQNCFCRIMVSEEFNSDIFREMNEHLNINVKTTGAESPWSNGVVEKYNGITSNMMEKVLSDVGCSLEVALAWCLSAKNALLNSYGYSPNQLVFGYNPNFSSVSDINYQL